MSINVSAIKCTLIPVKVTFSLSVNVLCNKYRLAFIHCIRLYVCNIKKSFTSFNLETFMGFEVRYTVDGPSLSRFLYSVGI